MEEPNDSHTKNSTQIENDEQRGTEQSDLNDTIEESKNPLNKTQMPQLPNNLPDLNDLDEDIRNMVISWYWAGYYKGRYDSKSS